jgi:hypothetical protein
VADAIAARRWQTVSFPPVEVVKTFYLGVDFHATFEKGVYVGMDKAVKRSRSRPAMPNERISDAKTRADWMLGPHLVPRKQSGERGGASFEERRRAGAASKCKGPAAAFPSEGAAWHPYVLCGSYPQDPFPS